MATFSGQVAPWHPGQATNVNGTVNLDGRTIERWQAYSVTGVAECPVAGQVVDNSPLPPFPGGTFSGQVACSFFNDFYDRVYFFPNPLDLGAVVSNRTEILQVWSAFTRPYQLDAVSPDPDPSMSLDRPAMPLTFRGLEMIEFPLMVQSDGPPTINAEYAFTFEGGNVQIWTVLGDRIAPWTVAHNWLESVLERLSWKTSIRTSKHGVEQRRSVRIGARRRFEIQGLVEGRDRRLLDLALFSWSGRAWAVPLYHEVQWIGPQAAGAVEIECDTGGREYAADGLVLLQDESATRFEMVQIREVLPDRLVLREPLDQAWPHGGKLYPAVPAHLVEQPRLARKSNDQAQWSAEFEVDGPYDAPTTATWPQYRGYPVLEQRPDETGDLTDTYARLVEILDNETGNPVYEDTADRAWSVQQLQYLLEGMEQHHWFRSLLSWFDGRRRAMWIPTWRPDLVIVSPVVIGEDTLEIEYMSYSVYGTAQPGRRDLRLQLRTGDVIYTRVIGAAAVSGDVERLQLESGLPMAFEPSDVVLASWLVLSRLDQDDVEIEHLADQEGGSRTSLLVKGVSDEL